MHVPWGETYIRRDFDHACIGAGFQRVHPGFCRLGVIDLRPLVASAEIIGLTIVVRHAVIVLNTIRQIEFCCFFRHFPPWRHLYKSVRGPCRNRSETHLPFLSEVFHCRIWSTFCMCSQECPFAAPYSCRQDFHDCSRADQFRGLCL